MEINIKKFLKENNDFFMVDTIHLFEEAYKANIIYKVFIESTIEHDYFKSLSEQVLSIKPMNFFKRFSNITSNQGIITICKKQEMPIIKNSRTILLDSVQDPGNLGSIVRTAYSFGYDVVYLYGNSVDKYNDKFIRSSQGACFHIPIIKINNLKAIEKNKYNFFLFDNDEKAVDIKNIKPQFPYCLVFGNEGHGLSNEISIIKKNTKVKIPINKFDSLNVAIASAIAMYNFE